MEINQARFVRGVIGSTDFLRDERPQIVFAGRSNVGKSSVINSLTRRKNLVRTSSVPGKTLQINFFLINDKFYFVDLPGYGFAKHSHKRREKLRKMILWYLTAGEARPAALVVIVDAKIGLKSFDRQMLDLAAEEGYRTIVVANKTDKLTQKELFALKRKLGEDKDIKAVAAQTIFYSAKTDRGRAELLQAIEDAMT